MLKILGGEFRSRVLLAPDDESISRPYGSRVKESLFNLLRGWFDDAIVLDLFAGVGTVGLEAVSRGAQQVYLVERNRTIFELLKRNIAMLKCEDRAVAVNADALSATALAGVRRPVSIIFVDPPYDMMTQERQRERVLQQAARCRELMGDKGFLALRSPIGTDRAEFGIAGFDGPESHRYGPDMHVLLYAPRPGTASIPGAGFVADTSAGGG